MVDRLARAARQPAHREVLGLDLHDRLLVTAETSERLAWQAPGAIAFVQELSAPTIALTFLPGGRELAIADEFRVSTIDAAIENETLSLPATRCGGILADDHRFCISYRSGIEIWERSVEDQSILTLVATITPAAADFPIALADGSSQLFVANQTQLRRIDLRSAADVSFELPGEWQPTAIEASSDGTLVALTRLDADRLPVRHLFRLDGSRLREDRQVAGCLRAEFSSDTQSLVSLQSNGELRIDDRLVAEIPGATTFDLSADNRYLLTGHAGSRLELRRFPSLELLTALPYPLDAALESVLLSPDGGTAAAVTTDQHLLVWRLTELYQKFSQLDLAWDPTGDHYQPPREAPLLTFKK